MNISEIKDLPSWSNYCEQYSYLKTCTRSCPLAKLELCWGIRNKHIVLEEVIKHNRKQKLEKLLS